MPKAPITKRGQETAAPDRTVEVPAPAHGPRDYEPSHIIQLMVELQRDTVAIGPKLERVISDVGTLSGKVDDLRMSFAWAKGCAIAALVLIPICAGFVWWLIGEQLNQMKAQLLQARPAVSQPAQPPPSIQPPRPQ
jgi:hypothetical protein